MKEIKIGLVIADKEEFLPFKPYADNFGAQSCDVLNREGYKFSFNGKENMVTVHTVISKIGKVNAAACASYLIASGCNMILNFGLSGGVSGVNRGDITIADCYLEHDFDLTMIGYKPCEKPGQEYIYSADKRLLEIFSKVLPKAMVGTAVCGDRFICNEADRTFLKESFKAVSCDMETGAIAAVCHMADVPFIALRRISDDAGSDAESSYREMNTGGETALADAFYNCLLAIADEF